jgi:multimeric flavodoxin WrbA
MKVLLHDLEEEEFEKIFPNIGEDITIVSKNAPIHNCIGCFGCWVKTPGACVIRDKYGDMGNSCQSVTSCKSSVSVFMEDIAVL